MVVGNLFSSAAVNNEKLEKQWNAVFPAEQKTEEDCLLFLSRMSYISIAEYLLHRELVSPKIFKRRRIGDVIFHTFSKDLRWGSKLSDMMRGIGEAIKLKYARQAFVMINEDENQPDLATEVFTVSFAYNEEDCLKITDENGSTILSMGYKGKDAFRKQVSYLIKKISTIVSSLQKFDRHVTPFIKLTYYDERTPEDYEPFAFQHCFTTYVFKNAPPRYDFGSITTFNGSSLIDIQSIYIDDVSTLEEAMLQEHNQQEYNFLDVTVDGDVTMNEAEEHRRASMESVVEFARSGHQEEEHIATVQQSESLLSEHQRLEEEDITINNSLVPSPDTTNEDDYVPAPVSENKRGGKKIPSKSRKSPIKKLSIKRRTKMPKNVESYDDVTISPPRKVSKGRTSPVHQIETSGRRKNTGGRNFKASVAARDLNRSPEDMLSP